MTIPALASSAKTATSTNNTITPVSPADLAAGDLVVICVSSDVGTGVVAWVVTENSLPMNLMPSPADLPEKGGATAGTAAQAFWSIYGGTGGFSATRTGGTGVHCAISLRWAAGTFDATTPFNAVNSTSSNLDEAALPSITTTVPDTNVIGWGTWNQGKTRTAIPPSYTDVQWEDLSSHDSNVVRMDKAVAGVVASEDWTLSAPAETTAIQFAVQEPQGGGGGGDEVQPTYRQLALLGVG